MKITVNHLSNEKVKSFTVISNELITSKDLNNSEFRVYIWLLHHKKGFKFNKTFGYKGLNMNDRTFEKALHGLHDKGYIFYTEKEITTLKYGASKSCSTN